MSPGHGALACRYCTRTRRKRRGERGAVSLTVTGVIALTVPGLLTQAVDVLDAKAAREAEIHRSLRRLDGQVPAGLVEPQ